jgi:hypothetical protein
MVMISSHNTVVAVRDENTAILHARSDALTKAAHVPGAKQRHLLPPVAAASSAATHIQLTIPGAIETKQCARATCHREVPDVSNRS